MPPFRRFAVYDPGPDALAQWGARWLGWDALTGCELASMAPDAWTRAPRRYGFHATIKAPFRLADGAKPDALGDALAALAADCAPVAMPRLSLTETGGFLALRPAPQPAALTALAAHVVSVLDHFRAPLTPEEIARRNPARLSPGARANLDRWGYPHVMEDFRYHMTLTGELPGPELARARAMLDPLLAPLLAQPQPQPQPVAALALMGEDAGGRFHLIRRCPLDGA